MGAANGGERRGEALVGALDAEVVALGEAAEAQLHDAGDRAGAVLGGAGAPVAGGHRGDRGDGRKRGEEQQGFHDVSWFRVSRRQ